MSNTLNFRSKQATLVAFSFVIDENAAVDSIVGDGVSVTKSLDTGLYACSFAATNAVLLSCVASVQKAVSDVTDVIIGSTGSTESTIDIEFVTVDVDGAAVDTDASITIHVQAVVNTPVVE